MVPSGEDLPAPRDGRGKSPVPPEPRELQPACSLIGARQGGEVCVCDLTAAFELTQPTISHHLKVLREAGIIDSQRRGTWVYYRLIPAALERVAALLAAPGA